MMVDRSIDDAEMTDTRTTPDCGPDAAEPSDAETGGEEDALPPMLREPTRLPGQARQRFSPEQFFALSRVTRTDVDASDEGLWLTQEACPKINPEGIRVGEELFWDPGLQPLVDVGDAVSGRTFVMRYNRALFARGVLDEVIILEQDASGGYRERCRCRPRHMATQVDLNRVLAERARLKEQLLAKIANAHAARITLEQGQKALEELRDEQARQARIQRRTKRAPIAAAPIDAKTEREARRAKESAQVFDLNERLQNATKPAAGGTVDQAPAEAPATGAVGSPAAPPKAKRRASRQKGTTPKRASAPSSVAGDPTGREHSGAPTLGSDEGRSPHPAPNVASKSLLDHFGGATGFVATEDD